MSLGPSPKSELGALDEVDLEQRGNDNSYLENRIIEKLSWQDITVTVPDRETKLPNEILSTVSGHVAAGKTLRAACQGKN